MWKTREGENSESEFPGAPITRIAKEELRERAIIGPTINIRGEIAGEEDLIIQGRIEGKIDLPEKRRHRSWERLRRSGCLRKGY